MLRGWHRVGFAGVLIAAASILPAQEPRAVPYWASISAGDALMRTGPGANYPATWRYRRADLPMKVLQIHESWRRVQDPDGVQGWMAAALLSKRRTAIVIGTIRELRATPSTDAKLAWRVEPGVVGRIAKCHDGWCDFDVQGKQGYIRIEGLWGIEPNEAID
jgi:SH3-like domain-containing protein